MSEFQALDCLEQNREVPVLGFGRGIVRGEEQPAQRVARQRHRATDERRENGMSE